MLLLSMLHMQTTIMTVEAALMIYHYTEPYNPPSDRLETCDIIGDLHDGVAMEAVCLIRLQVKGSQQFVLKLLSNLFVYVEDTCHCCS